MVNQMLESYQICISALCYYVLLYVFYLLCHHCLSAFQLFSKGVNWCDLVFFFPFCLCNQVFWHGWLCLGYTKLLISVGENKESVLCIWDRVARLGSRVSVALHSQSNWLTDFQGRRVESLRRAASGSAYLGFHTPLTINQLKLSWLHEIASCPCSEYLPRALKEHGFKPILNSFN